MNACDELKQKTFVLLQAILKDAKNLSDEHISKIEESLVTETATINDRLKMSVYYFNTAPMSNLRCQNLCWLINNVPNQPILAFPFFNAFELLNSEHHKQTDLCWNAQVIAYPADAFVLINAALASWDPIVKEQLSQDALKLSPNDPLINQFLGWLTLQGQPHMVR